MFSQSTGSRAETEYNLYNTVLRKKIDKAFFDEDAGDMYGFKRENGRLYLEYSNYSTLEDLKYDLDTLYKKLTR